MKVLLNFRRPAPYEVFQAVTRPTHLLEIYETRIRGSQVRGRDGCTPESLDESIETMTRRISTRLRDGDFRFTQYREMTIPRGADKKPRILSIPTVRDRIALRAMAEFLVSIYPFAKGVLASQRVAEVIEDLESNVSNDRQYDAYIRLDVENFYPNIRHADIETQLRVRIRKSAAIRNIMRAVATPTVADRHPAGSRTVVGVPQGLAISNALAELVAHPIDRQFMQDPRCEYRRYVDDILVVCRQSDVKQIANEIYAAFKQRGLTVHQLWKGGKSRTGRLSDGFDFLGYTFKDSGRSSKPIQVSVRKSSVTAIEGRLTRIFSEYRKLSKTEPEVARLRCELQLSLTVAGCIFDNNPRGWLPYYRQLNDLTLLKHLDSMVQMLARRYSLPKSFRPKKFVRAYWAIRYPYSRDAGYIKSYDDLTVPEQRSILIIITGKREESLLSDDQVPSAFRRAMNHLLTDFERDIGDRS